MEDYIKNIIISLIILFAIKIISLSIYIYYEKELSKKITGFKDIIQEKFTDLIDIETMNSALIDGKYDENFITIDVESNNSIFTKELIIQLIKKNGKENGIEIIKNYIKDTNNINALNILITRYYEISSEIDKGLLDNYDDNKQKIKIVKEFKKYDIMINKLFRDLLCLEGLLISILTHSSSR